MPLWFRNCPMRIPPGDFHWEIWISEDGYQRRSYEVRVRLGKPIDILSLKSDVIENFKAQVCHVRSTRTSAFASEEVETVSSCPICALPTADSKFCANIYGGLYHQCSSCSHCFVMKKPTKPALEKFYLTDVHYASTYTSKQKAETRVKEVAKPKAEWLCQEFCALYGRRPTSILDVGAGGGHFVYACQQLGTKARGIELSMASREFSKRNFNLDLDPIDFTKEWERFSDAEVVTFWGIIEHVADPIGLLQAAYKLLAGKESLVVASVPRWDSVSTGVQKLFPDSVARHLDPLGHIQCFTDSSFATAFEVSGFAPVAAWYFGLDAYELATQLAHALQDARVMDVVGKHVPFLQSILDRGRLSDSLVLAGKPKKPLEVVPAQGEQSS